MRDLATLVQSQQNASPRAQTPVPWLRWILLVLLDLEPAKRRRQ